MTRLYETSCAGVKMWLMIAFAWQLLTPFSRRQSTTAFAGGFAARICKARVEFTSAPRMGLAGLGLGLVVG